MKGQRPKKGGGKIICKERDVKEREGGLKLPALS